MIATVIYYASSGNVYNLQVARMVRIKEANFHEYAWSYDSTERRYGITINRFTKEPYAYDVKLIFIGSRESRRQNIEELHADFERDILNQTPGRIVWGDCYIDAYVIESSSYPNDQDNWSDNDVTFLCPYPFWIQEHTVSITAIDQSSIVTETDKQYSYQYPYSYAINPVNTWINLNFYSDCDFKLTAYGPFSELYVTINGHPYNIDFAADASEYMVIDSRASGTAKGQAYLVRANGTKVNVFDYRNPLYSIFQKISGESVTITYPRTYGIDLTFFMERSEPVRGSVDTDNYATLLTDGGLPLAAYLGEN